MHLRSCLIEILCELQSTRPATQTSLGTTPGAIGTPTIKMLTYTKFGFGITLPTGVPSTTASTTTTPATGAVGLCSRYVKLVLQSYIFVDNLLYKSTIKNNHTYCTMRTARFMHMKQNSAHYRQVLIAARIPHCFAVYSACAFNALHILSSCLFSL